VVEKEITVTFFMNFDYTHMNEAMMLIRKYEGTLKKQKMELFCEFEIAVPLRLSDAFREQAKTTFALKISQTDALQ
jgi:hypothetical protein